MGRKLRPGVDKISEGWVKKEVKKILKEFSNIKVDMPAANQYGTAGRHDFVICQQGLFWTIETKAGKNKPTELQEMYAEDIHAADGLCIAVNEFNLFLPKHVAIFVREKNKLPLKIQHRFFEFNPTKLKKEYLDVHS